MSVTMAVRRLLLVLCCSGVLAVTRSVQVDGSSCVTDYYTNISCVLNVSAARLDSTYTLNFTEEDSFVHCPLTARTHSYTCNCQIKKDDMFADFNKYRIELCDESSCQDVMKEFWPYLNIKLSPPPDLLVQQSADGVNVTCLSPAYDHHMYLKGKLQYELDLQTSGSAEPKTMSLSQPQTSVSIDGSALRAGAEHCVRARYRPNPQPYSSVWSEWSRASCWISQAGPEDKNILVTLFTSVGPLCMLLLVLLLVLCSPAARMKMKTLSHTPSPAPFFQPLFQQHKGNVQDWLSPGGRFELTYQTEEELPPKAVTVLPKSLPKGTSEETLSVLVPAAAQLEFAQCHDSYVGLPGMEKAPPPPPTMMCAVDSSYTQLPCPLWEFPVVEVFVSSRPADILEVSQADSGCSCEDLTQSPESSLPSSPLHHSPPPGFCSDYCILNKTSAGVVPVLVSKEGREKEEEEEEEEEAV